MLYSSSYYLKKDTLLFCTEVGVQYCMYTMWGANIDNIFYYIPSTFSIGKSADKASGYFYHSETTCKVW